MENSIEPIETSVNAPVGNDKLFAVLCYLDLWMFALISNPEKNHEFVRNHIKNGIILSVCLMVLAVIPFVGWIAEIAVLVFSIIGIVKAIKGEEYNLPIFGNMFKSLNSEKVVSVMCYISCGWIYALISYPEKESEAVKSHINNGILLSLGYVICAIIPVLGWICEIVLLVFAIIGIVKAVKGEEYSLPAVGGIKIIK